MFFCVWLCIWNEIKENFHFKNTFQHALLPPNQTENRKTRLTRKSLTHFLHFFYNLLHLAWPSNSKTRERRRQITRADQLFSLMQRPPVPLLLTRDTFFDQTRIIFPEIQNRQSFLREKISLSLSLSSRVINAQLFPFILIRSERKRELSFSCAV